MKKTKILVMTLAIVLCLSLSTTAYAATTSTGSPVGGGTSIISDVPAGVHIVAGSVDAAKTATINSAITQNNIQGTMVSLQDIHMEDANGVAYNPSVNNPVKLRIYYAVHPYDKATIAHLRQDGVVEFISATCFEGYVEFSLTSFSPVGLIVQPGTAPADSSSASATVSPKTNEAADFTAVWYIVAAAAAIVLAASIRTILKTGKER